MTTFNNNLLNNDTICAVATPPGPGAIAVIRMSGNESLEVLWKVFRPLNTRLDKNRMESHKLYFGKIVDNEQEIDEVLVSWFKAPHSYSGEDSVEISLK